MASAMAVPVTTAVSWRRAYEHCASSGKLQESTLPEGNLQKGPLLEGTLLEGTLWRVAMATAMATAMVMILSRRPRERCGMACGFTVPSRLLHSGRPSVF